MACNADYVLKVARQTIAGLRSVFSLFFMNITDVSNTFNVRLNSLLYKMVGLYPYTQFNKSAALTLNVLFSPQMDALLAIFILIGWKVRHDDTNVFLKVSLLDYPRLRRHLLTLSGTLCIGLRAASFPSLLTRPSRTPSPPSPPSPFPLFTRRVQRQPPPLEILASDNEA